MVAGDVKRVVVLRNISSNIIEEAILILKSEPGTGGSDGAKAGCEKSRQDNDFLMKEAEMIINNYIKDNRIQVVQDRRNPAKGKFFRSRTLSNVFLNIIMLACVAFLIYIVCRLI